MAGSQYYFRQGDRECGPFSSSQLRQLAAVQAIRPDDFIRKDGIDKWVRADTIRGLFATRSALPVQQKPDIRLTKLETPAAPAQLGDPGEFGPLPPLETIPEEFAPPPENSKTTPYFTFEKVLVASILGAFTFALLGWMAVSFLLPLTPREVCERFDHAKTLEESKKYCTLNLHHALEAIYRHPPPPSDDPFEYTREGDAPASVGGYFVGVRGHVFDPELRRRIQIDAVYHLVDRDGWKVEDIYFLALDHVRLQEPVSLASNFAAFEQPPTVTSPAPSPAHLNTQANANRAKSWLENTQVRGPLVYMLGRFGAKGWKWVAGLFVAAWIACAAVWKGRNSPATSSRRQ
ncbi:MAG: DUF4339 domain-containing protein [Gemmataceae bacterium]